MEISAWMKDVFQELLIGLGSGILLVLCSFLCKLILKRWHARRAALRTRPTSPDADSGEQSLPHADAMHDIEMGSLNSREVADLPRSSSPDNIGNAAEEYMETTSQTVDDSIRAMLRLLVSIV